MPTNTILHVDDNREFRVDRGIAIPKPGEGQLLVKVLFSGVNPADIKHSKLLGIYPSILGYDYCGEVLQAPKGSPFQVGQIVAGHTRGTHQSFLTCPEDEAFIVPSKMPREHAACLTVVAMTAAGAIYNIFGYSLPQESSTNEQNNAAPLLIWGASSSVGVCAVQFARASGVYPIIVTASPERHGLLKELGATYCFDYKSPTVHDEIATHISDAQCAPIKYAIDAVGSTSNGGSAALMAGCVSESAIVASVVFQQDKRFMFPSPGGKTAFKVTLPHNPQPIEIPARPAEYQRSVKALTWAIKHYRADFRLPSVEVFEGTAEDALEQLKAIANFGRGFGKLVLKHPLT